MSFLANLEWRRAVKHFGSEPVDTTPIRNAIINAPSSFGLQPYKVIAVKNAELKAKLHPVSYGQDQVKECDTVFIFCAYKNVEERANQYLKETGAEGIRDMLFGFLSYLPDKVAWASRQAYIALGFALAACAESKIASCPMEGFNGAEVSKILGLEENLVPIVYLAVGSLTEKDGTWPRFRFDASDLIQDVE